MIEATEADVGRRVIYDCRPIIKTQERGTLVGVEGRYAIVLFDHQVMETPNTPLKVGSNLRWAEQ